jgi:hypothetical protein
MPKFTWTSKPYRFKWTIDMNTQPKLTLERPPPPPVDTLNSEKSHMVFGVDLGAYPSESMVTIAERSPDGSITIMEHSHFSLSKPWCARCNEPVDMMTKGRDETKGLVIITVHCHGATERVELEDEILEDQYGKNISFTEAFRARK